MTRTPHIVRYKRDHDRHAALDKADLLVRALERADSAWARAAFVSSSAALRGPLPEADHTVIDFDGSVPALATDLSEEEVLALRNDPSVEEVEPDVWAEATSLISSRGLSEPDATSSKTPALEALPWGLEAIDAPRAWPTSMGGGIRIAVLDTGIDASHPDLAPNCRGGASFVPQTSDPSDDNGHGTHCAGILAGCIRGTLGVGVAPGVELYSVKVLGADRRGLFAWVGAGVEWAVEARVDILHLSVVAPTMPHTIQLVFEAAWRAGVLVVAAAGNGTGAVGYPARLPSCVAVSAVDPSMELAGFSDCGPEIELCAPGVDVLSTWPGARYRRDSGTSMASPHVAGAAALAWASHRSANADDIRRLLRETARALPGSREHFGHGLVDAFAAVRAR